jgi:putative component of membrane protein insertase Oxa1/YidC/SpoIIIJ protein YidD
LGALALRAIRLYQRHLSPLKGYRCAYRVHTGCASCSQLGYRAIRRYGLWGGLALLQMRLHRCAVAHARFGQSRIAQAQISPARRSLSQQAGVCDLPCDLPCASPVDAIDGDCLGFACGVGDCCNGWSRKKVPKDDAMVHIPPDTRKHRRPAR